MTKSIKAGKVIYTFLDVARGNVEIEVLRGNTLWIFSESKNLPLNQETTKDLIKVLQEFVETGELK